MDEQVQAVINAIPYGKGNAISREALSAKLGVTDRKARSYIEQARRDGHQICNDQDGAGYYQSDDVDVLLRQYRQDMARIKAISRRAKPTRKILKEKAAL